ncbi:MAG: hypothetical protein RBQ91_02175 [Acholeplasma sp.]|nr:hypothetical protein [Acholeplasma sp.]
MKHLSKALLTIMLFLSLGIFASSINAAQYQDYIDSGTQSVPVTSDTWVTLGTYDYMVPKGYKPADILTASAGTEVGAYFITSGVSAGRFKSDGSSTAAFSTSGFTNVSFWNGSSWVSYNGSDISVRINGSTWGYYKYGGSTLVSTISGASPSFGLRRATTDKQPVLSGESVFVLNIDNPLSWNTIKSNIFAYDETDGDLTHAIVFSTPSKWNGSAWVGLSVSDNFTATATVEDSAGNEASMIINFIVKDVTAPTFGISTANKTQSVSYTQTFNIEGFKTSLLVSDNTDASPTVTVKSNTYTANKTTPGTYSIVYEASDVYGNKASTTITIRVVDDVKPTINGGTTYTKPTTSVVTVADVKAGLTAIDAIDGTITNKITVIEDNYTGNGHVNGSYTIVFGVTDNSGNSNTFTVTVTVVDNIPPILYVKDKFFITVDESVSLSHQDFIDILITTGQLTVNSTTQYKILLDDYTENKANEGSYTISFKFTSTSGEVSEHTLYVNVLSDGLSDGSLTPEEESIPLITWATENPLQATLILIGSLFVLFVAIKAVIKINKKSVAIKRRRK